MPAKHACAAVLLALCAAPVLADDPKDPAMRSQAAREADRAAIRRLNLEQLAAVRARDAGYAEGWAAWRAKGDPAGDPAAARGDYAERSAWHRQALADNAAAQADYGAAQADYARRMAAWRRAVAACEAGDWSACAD